MLKRTNSNGHRTHSSLPLLAGALSASLAFGCSGYQQAGPAFPSSSEPSTTSTAQAEASDAEAQAADSDVGARATSAAAAQEPTASGATGQPAGESTAAPAAPAEVSDAEIETFARAYAEIATIQQRYQQQATTSSQDELQTLQEEMNREVQAALEKEGVSPQQFDTIARSAEQHPEVRTRVQQALEEQHQPQAQ